MLNAEETRNKGRIIPTLTKAEPDRASVPAPAKTIVAGLPPQFCVLCGEPCPVSRLANTAGMELQFCPTCHPGGSLRRKSEVSARLVGSK